MSMNQRISRIANKNTKMGPKACQAGRVLAAFYADEGKNEFAIDYLYRYGKCVMVSRTSSVNNTEFALESVTGCVSPDYEAEVASNGINEARILTYTMEMGQTFIGTLSHASTLAIMAAMIDVALRVDHLNKAGKADPAWKININQAINETARIGYRLATRKNANPDAYAIAVEAMDQIDGDLGEYGVVPTLVEELYATFMGKPILTREVPIFRFGPKDFDAPDQPDVKPAFFGGDLFADEEPARTLRLVPQEEDEEDDEPPAFGGSLWDD